MEVSRDLCPLSRRSAAAINKLKVPWRFALPQTYDAETNPEGLISFALAENKLVTADIERFVNNNVKFEPSDFTYASSAAGRPRFPAALACHLNEYLQPHEPVQPDHIQVTNAATSMHEVLAWAFADPGDGILTSRPVYGRFELDFGNRAQVDVVYADTVPETCFDESVVDKFDEARVRSEANGVSIKAVLIVNPHNPLGQCYPRETLVAIMRYCQQHRLQLISDEIYACSTFDSGEPSAVPFTSALAIDPEGLIDRDRLHVTYGLSKDFGAAGLRLGAIVTRSPAVKSAIATVSRFHSPAGPSLAISAAMLEDREWCRDFIDTSRRKLAAAYKHATRCLRGIGVEFLPGSNAGFFLWIDLSPFLVKKANDVAPSEASEEPYDEVALAQKLVEAGVFFHPREEHSLKPGWFRMVYTQKADVVTEGIKRLGRVITMKCTDALVNEERDRLA